MPLRDLRKLRDYLADLIATLENGPRREIDIAMEHAGKLEMIARVLRTEGDRNSSSWIQVERIFCSPPKCSACPHGDYFYRYRRNKKGTVTVQYLGKAFLEHEDLEWLEEGIRDPI